MIDRVNLSVGRRRWLVAALGVVALALALDVLVRNDPIAVDFHTYLAASQVGLQKGWSHVYDQGFVAIQQKELDAGQRSQPFLSPPTVAFVAAPLARVPYDVAYVIWALLCFAAFAASMVWSGVSRGLSRWIAVVGALGPWWVMHSVNVGQVVPLVAAGTVVAWRLLREKRDLLAGLALLAILLKPNTAVLLPVAVLFAGRFRVLAAWAGGSAVIGVIVLLTFGMSGITDYVTQLRGPLPSGADDLTLHGVLGATGPFALALRILVIAIVCTGAFKLRNSPGLVLALAIVGSLVISPYLHASDLCVLAGAGFMVWETRPVVSWRAILVAGWLLASPFLYLKGFSPHLSQWPWFEFVLLAAFVVAAWWPLTAWGDARRHAPA